MKSVHGVGGLLVVVLLCVALAPVAFARVDWVTGEGAWAFEYPEDEFTEEAWLDLRHLNEEQSGQHGFVRLSEDGNSFVRGDGEPIRFWAVTSYAWRNSPEHMDRHARFLAKIGVNMVRLHLDIAPTEEGERITDVDTETIDGVWRFIKSCKDAGIYMTISPYWYHRGIPESWTEDLPGYEAGDRPAGALFFNPVFREAYKGWIEYFYTETNPYTGLAIKDDPTVAILQAKNEDSLLFFTSQRIPPEQVEILGGQYHDWLVEKYGSIERAYDAWDGHRIDEEGGVMGRLLDAPDEGRLGLYIIWEMTQDHTGGMARRLDDQLEFMAYVQYDFYRDIDEYITETLGCRQITNAMNWKTADPVRLYDAERWSYTAMDIMAVNNYFGPIHVGENTGYRIDPGHFMANRSVMREPLSMPTNLKQVAGAPMLVTETSWVRPNLYQSEGALLAAAYKSLTGVDSFYWFAQSEADYQRDPRRMFWHVAPGDTGYALNIWTVASPAQQGMFPASALLFRKGYVEQGEPVVHEHRTLESIWQRERPVISETTTFDPNRDVEDLRYEELEELDVSRLAFLVGPVRVTYDSDPDLTQVADLTPYIDGRQNVVRSNTGQIALNWDKGLFTLDAPKAKGVTGFLREAGERFELDGLTMRCENDYATLQVVSMDERPLRESRRVLVQAGTTNRLTGWETQPAEFEHGDRMVQGKEIVATGKPPFLVEEILASVSLQNPHLSRAMLLDPAGYPDREVEVRREGETLTVELPENTMYLILY